jgi:hypothetical protein
LTTSLFARWSRPDGRNQRPRVGFNARFGAIRMEPLWSQAGATSGNQWQTLRAQKPPKQAKTVATGCHQLPIGAHGKEGVDGSSPSEGSRNPLVISSFWSPAM